MSENEKVNDTILNMVKNFKSSTESGVVGTSNGDIKTPLKRSVSSSNSNDSFEDLNPLKRRRQERNLDLSYIGSPRETRRLRADLVEARNTILSLESRISRMHGMTKEMQMLFDEENTALKKQSEYDKKTIEELENQLQVVRKRELELKNSLSEVNAKYDMLKLQSSEQVEKLETSLEHIKEESKHSSADEKSTILSLERRITALEAMLDAAEGDASMQKKLAADLEKRLSENNNAVKELELKEQALQKAKLYIKDLEYAKENYLEFQDQAKTQVQKLAHYVELQKENEILKEENIRLKEDVRNKLLLEEEVYTLQSRLVKFKEYEKKLAELQVQQTQNALHLNEWRAVARGICESTDCDSALPHLLRSVVERLQQQELTLTSEKVELDSQLKTALHEAKVAKAELEKNLKLMSELKTTGEQKQNLIHRMQKKLLLVSRERDSYRQQLDSYEKDLTICATTSSMSNQLQTYKERIDNLEKIVDNYRDMVSKLESDLQSMQPQLQSDIVPAKVDQITRLQNEVQQLKNENDKLRNRRDELEIQLESYITGNDTLQGGQVYHLANNPISDYLNQREKYVEKMEQEVDKLKKKIKNMEDGLESSRLGDITMSTKEVQALKEQIRVQEEKEKVWKEFMKSQMQEFRNVIYMLFGYKIDRTQNSLYKLRNMYAEQAEDQLVFQVDKDGNLNMLENEYSATLGDMISIHLGIHKSIPVFLSALTMDLFNTKTKTMQIE